MATPSPRNKILPARGLYADLNASLADLLEGEICYATDEDQYYQKEGGVLVAVGATKAQGLLADSAIQPLDNVSELTIDITTDDLTEGTTNLYSQWDDATGGINYAAGNVGIGTTSPSNKLDVDGAIKGSGLIFGNTSSYLYEGAANSIALRIGSDGPYAQFVDDGSNVLKFGNAGGQLALSSAGTERLRIDSSGNVGIGTSSPLAPLHIAGAETYVSNTGPAEYRLYNGGAVTEWALGQRSSTDHNLSISTKVGTTYTPRLSITSGGNVGIGTTSPLVKLTVSEVTSGGLGGLSNTVGYFGFSQTSNLFGGVALGAGVNGNTPFLAATRKDDGTGLPLTFSTDGTERARIDSSGNVGIGTTSPGQKLVVSEGGAQGLELNPTSATAFVLAGYNRNTSAYIDLDYQGNNHIFRNGTTERLRITSAGNVGIGTSSPTQGKLVVGGTPTAGLPAINVDQYGANFLNTSDIQLSANSVLSAVNSINCNIVSGFFAVHGGGAANTGLDGTTEYFRITSAGLVGIGTTNPQALLHLAANAPYITFEDKDNNQDWQIQATAWFALRNQSTSSELLRITSSGDVGIGVASPTVKLDINGTAKIRSAQQLQFNNSDNTSGCSIQAENTTNVPGLTFNTFGAERLRIDSSGRLLVGTSTSLQAKYAGSGFQPGFQNAAVSGTGGFFRYANNNDGAALVFNKSRNTTVGGHTIVNNNETLGYLGFTGSDGTQFQTAASITGVTDGTPGANDMPGRLVFSTTAAGASTPTERMRISSDGSITLSSSNGTTASHSSLSRVVQIGNAATVDAALNIGGGFTGDASLNIRDLSGTATSFYFGTTKVGSITLSASATAYNTSSDYRLKENVTPMTGAADRVKALKPCRFNFIADATKTVDGFLAHEAQEVVPESVTGTKDAMEDIGTLTEWDGTILETNTPEPDSLTWDETITDEDGNETVETRTRTWVKTGDRPVMQAIDQSKLVPLLTAALQEALAKIDDLEARLSTAGL